MTSQDKKASDKPTTDDSTPSRDGGPLQRRPRSLLDRLRTSIVIFLILCISGVCLAAVLAVPLVYYFEKCKSDIVESVVPAGRVITLRLHSGLMISALVETDLGFYALTSGVSLGKREALTVELRAGAERFLCDAQHRCTRLF